MKLLLLTFLLMPFIGLSQDTIVEMDTDKYDESNVVDFPDVEASYPGGMSALLKFVNDNIVYPKGNYDTDPPSRIIVSFILDEKGVIHNITIRENGWKEGEKAVHEMVEKMPNWIPAEHNGKKVATRVRFPIIIDLY